MKKFATIAIAALMIFAFCTPFAMAADKLLNAKVSNVKIAKDKNGAEYVRLMVETPRELNGVQYTTATPAMAFGEHAARAKTLKAGQTVRMIVSEKEYQGRQSFTVIKIVE